jgi:hypothetical protein
MIARFFHRWEEQLASASRDERVVRPFEWGLDWMAHHPAPFSDPHTLARDWVADVMKDTDAFFTPTPTADYTFTPADPIVQAGGEAGTLSFPSGFVTPHPENNTVYARYFPANPIRKPRTPRAHRRAVVVLAQWNSTGRPHRL